MAKSRKSRVGLEIVRRLRRFVEKLESADALTDSFTRRTVRLNLEPTRYNPRLVKDTRRILGASQVIFAQFLGVAPNTVRDWEQGTKQPHGAARRIMDEIRQNPDYWLSRLKQLAKPVARSNGRGR